MKRIIALLAFSLFASSCDDGNMDVESFDFGTAQPVACNLDIANNFFLFKTTGNEALIVQLPQNMLRNQETDPNAPIELLTGGNVKVIYRLYDGSVTNATICSPIPSSSPVVVDEWLAREGGKISIATNVVRDVNETTGAIFITGYSHTLTLLNMTFDRGGDNDQVIDQITFGSYKTPSQRPIEFANLIMKRCEGTNTLYKFSGPEVMELNFDNESWAQLFQPSATGTSPRTAMVNAGNQVTYRKYASILNDDQVCGGTAGTPLQDWYAQDGVSNVSGIIEVSTESDPGTGGWEHTIVFRKLIFANEVNDLTFTYGNAYTFGSFITE